jgi:hypothetical protein
MISYERLMLLQNLLEVLEELGQLDCSTLGGLDGFVALLYVAHCSIQYIWNKLYCALR